MKWGDKYLDEYKFSRITHHDRDCSTLARKVLSNIIFYYTRVHPCRAIYWIYYSVFIIMDWISDIIYFTSVPFYTRTLGYLCIVFYLAPIVVCFGLGFFRREGSFSYRFTIFALYYMDHIRVNTDPIQYFE